MDKEVKCFLSEFSEELNNGKKIIAIPAQIAERISRDCLLKIEKFAHVMHKWRQRSLNSKTILRAISAHGQ